MQCPDLETASREALIQWLQWNGRNGSYSDAENDGEGLPRLTRADAVAAICDQLELMPLYRVTADSEAGFWRDDLELIGHVSCAEHYAMRDTGAEHYDTFELEGVTCAVVVTFRG